MDSIRKNMGSFVLPDFYSIDAAMDSTHCPFFGKAYAYASFIESLKRHPLQDYSKNAFNA